MFLLATWLTCAQAHDLVSRAAENDLPPVHKKEVIQQLKNAAPKHCSWNLLWLPENPKKK